jgi:hypothetical protein
VTTVDGIRVMSIASTLALLAPEYGIGPTARALDSALRMGVSTDELRTVAQTWRRRGRRGPPALLVLLGERVDNRLPRSWFQRVAARVLAVAGVRLVDEYPVRDRRGILLAELDLADPARQLLSRCKRPRRESRDDRYIQNRKVAKLRDHIAAAIDHDGQFCIRFLKEIGKDAVETGDVLDR